MLSTVNINLKSSLVSCKDLTGGDPPLISVVKRKYSLTTQPNGAAGVDVANALHIMAHRHNLCRCGRSIES